VTGLALALVLASAGVHTAWNVLAKRIRAEAHDAWLFTTLAAVIYAPLAVGVIVVHRPAIGGRELLFMAGTAVLHTAYFLLLLRGYRAGGLSLVYPLARGTGPLLSTVAAILLLGERPSPLALTGASLIGVSVFVLTWSPRGSSGHRSSRAIVYALLTGAMIALYTLWDKYAVSVVGIHPILLEWGGGIGRGLLLAPMAAAHWPKVRTRLRTHPREIVGVAVLSPLAYIMVLSALVFAPVSYVAPLREVSILIGAVVGTRFLAEDDATRRWAAAAMMTCGVVLLTVG
jgi:drug/metabolite transporter (DMT)-like permease